MDLQMIEDYLVKISKERRYGKCLITRWKRIMEVLSIDEFAKADDTKLVNALGEYGKRETRKTTKPGSVIESWCGGHEPFIGAKLFALCHDAQAYIIAERAEEKKEKVAAENRKNFEVLIERKRNPVFTVKALKSVIALAELAGAETVNLDRIFEVCDAFGVSLDAAPAKEVTT